MLQVYTVISYILRRPRGEIRVYPSMYNGVHVQDILMSKWTQDPEMFQTKTEYPRV